MGLADDRVARTVGERSILVAVQTAGQTVRQVEQSLEELGRLAETAGASVVDKLWQAKGKPDPRLFMGKGKAEEVRLRVAAEAIDSVIFDDELSPSQQLNLEELIGAPVIDRTGLILDIFAQHAHSAEGKLQVELAQNRYYLPRLKGLWLHLSRLGGGIGTRGPGETQLETDRRRLRQRVQKLERDLGELGKTRKTQRRSRKKRAVFGAALVGYTNAGKSSLLGRLTGTEVYVADQLFATLDSATRRIELPSGIGATITDTVGFIKKLPHELIAAFQSTLDEVVDADLLVHAIDASDPDIEGQVGAVEGVLTEIGTGDVPRIRVFNKIDLIDNDTRERLAKTSDSVMTSCLDGTGIDQLRVKIDRAFTSEMVEVTAKIPYQYGSDVQWFFETGIVISSKHLAEGYEIRGRLRRRDIVKIERYLER